VAGTGGSARDSCSNDCIAVQPDNAPSSAPKRAIFNIRILDYPGVAKRSSACRCVSYQILAFSPTGAEPPFNFEIPWVCCFHWLFAFSGREEPRKRGIVESWRRFKDFSENTDNDD